MSAQITDAYYSAFQGHRHVARGDLRAVLTALAQRHDEDAETPVLILDDLTGDRIEPDPRDDLETSLARLTGSDSDGQVEQPRSGRGRPRLGVVAREVTLLPRHWDWLQAQPGGASATLRRLVETARREGATADQARRSHRALDRFLTLVAGDLPLFEEVYRAFYAGASDRFTSLTQDWPTDLRDHAHELLVRALADQAHAASAPPKNLA